MHEFAFMYVYVYMCLCFILMSMHACFLLCDVITNSKFYTFTDWYDDNGKFIVARDTNYCPNIQSISVLLSNLSMHACFLLCDVM
jgi:hypothetical protein